MRASVVCLAALASLAQAQCFPSGSLAFRSPVVTAPGLAARPIANNLTTPRGITFDEHGVLLVVERGLGVTAFAEGTPACPRGWLRTHVLNNSALTQGIQVRGADLYVSTAGAVLRYAYDARTRTVAAAEPVVIVSGIPPDGELTTRPLLLHGHELLVSSAPAANIDPTAQNASSGRSQIRSFALSGRTPAGPQEFLANGTLFAYGIRNPAGFAFRGPERLYVVENGASLDNVTGLTPVFVNDNPADELELVRLPRGRDAFFGFPDCATLWNPDADRSGDPQYARLRPGAQFSLHLDADRDDTWCRNASNNVPPRLSFQAHSVPLDLKFFAASKGSSFPTEWDGDAFVSFHGSFNRAPPTGYGIVRVPFNGGYPTASTSSTDGYSFLVQAANLTTCPGTCIRPVGLAFSKKGRLFVSSDSSGELFVVSLG